MDEKTILKGILDSYPYPLCLVDNDYIIRYLTGMQNTITIKREDTGI